MADLIFDDREVKPSRAFARFSQEDITLENADLYQQDDEMPLIVEAQDYQDELADPIMEEREDLLELVAKLHMQNKSILRSQNQMLEIMSNLLLKNSRFQSVMLERTEPKSLWEHIANFLRL